MCTHLATELSIPYSGVHGSHEGQQLYELNEVQNFIDDKEDGCPQVLMGDFNFGPEVASENISAEFPDHYYSVVDDGWIGANTGSTTPFCTWCPSSNPLSTGDNDGILDHIFVRGAKIQTSAPVRIYDDLRNFFGYEFTLSDHYGSQAKVSYKSDCATN